MQNKQLIEAVSQHGFELEADIIEKARLPIQRMLELSPRP